MQQDQICINIDEISKCAAKIEEVALYEDGEISILESMCLIIK